MSNSNATEETYIRRLPYSVHCRIASHLDPYKKWMDFAQNIPKKLDFQNFQERYSITNLQQFELEGQRPHGSPTKSILNDWGKENPTVQHLLQVLITAELYAVADYISMEILGRCPVERNSAHENANIAGMIPGPLPPEDDNNFLDLPDLPPIGNEDLYSQ